MCLHNKVWLFCSHSCNFLVFLPQLIRMVLRQSFEVLRRNGWNERYSVQETKTALTNLKPLAGVGYQHIRVSHVGSISCVKCLCLVCLSFTRFPSLSFTEPFLGLLMKEIMHSESNAPVGIKLHFVDIYLEELANVGSKEVGSKTFLMHIAVLWDRLSPMK